MAIGSSVRSNNGRAENRSPCCCKPRTLIRDVAEGGASQKQVRVFQEHVYGARKQVEEAKMNVMQAGTE